MPETSTALSGKPRSTSQARPRHRGVGRTSRAAKTLGKTAAVTGVAAAVPIVGLSTPADAATTSTWERLAECESSGRWNINTGNGYYGGLQFSASTWRAFGGTQYAARADLATKSQQIAIAEKVLRVQGWGAWPACSRKLGLGEADKRGGGSRDESRSRSSRGTERAKSSKPSRAKAPKSRSVDTRSPRERSAAPGSSYVIKAGDTLSKIAAEHDVDGGWKALWKLNRSLVGGNPDLIFPGEKLRLR